MTRHPARNKQTVLIIGGGASGLAAACVCAQTGQPFVLLEKEKKLGRKLLATGNGRCNLMNLGPGVFFGDEAFSNQVLSRCGTKEVGQFFSDLGLTFFEEEEGRVYPNTRQATSVLDCLLACIEKAKDSRVVTDCAVKDIRKTAEGFLVDTSQGRFEANQLILAVGGPAAPKLGGDERLLASMKALGHAVLPFFPALTPLETDTGAIRNMNGLRVPSYLTLFHDELAVSRAAGEVFYADYGLSGLCSMQLSREARQGLMEGRQVSIEIDVRPLLGLAPVKMRRLPMDEYDPQSARQDVLELLKKRQASLGVDRLYTGLLPGKMIEKVQNLSPERAANWLSGLRLKVTDTKGYDQAQVAAGGLDCADFFADTMESKVHPGLYACGEALNVDGDTGGFNLLFAWATGMLAGRAVAGSRSAL